MLKCHKLKILEKKLEESLDETSFEKIQEAKNAWKHQ